MAQLKHALDELDRRIGIGINDRTRLERALTHASLRTRGGSASYERLEFLGDRVLGLVIAERLFELFPAASEGELSLRLNALVSAETCAEIADEIGLADFIRHGGDVKRLRGVKTQNIRADVVESLIAALYLGNGLADARRFILRFWEARLGRVGAARRDAKTALQEWVHTRTTVPPRYETVGRSGPDHDPVFTVRAVIEDVAPAEGSGRNKRLAEQDAAAVVLRREGIWKDGD